MGIKMKLRGLFASALLALTMAAPTQSFAVSNVLFLTMDGSGSIGSSNFTLQKQGYVTALNNVFSSSGLYGNTAIGVSVFNDGITYSRSIQEIDTLADLNALTTAIAGIGYPGGLTAVGTAIGHAAGQINAFGLGTNNVIDVSTDGQSNRGPDPDGVAAGLMPNIVTNCIGIGSGADCSFATGFSVSVTNFGDFAAALEKKLRRELNVPEPSIVALMAVGLLGFGFVRRRSA